MLKNKIVRLRKIYKFYFNNFLLKPTVFFLSIMNGFYKIKKSIFRPNYSRSEKMLRKKILYLRKIYKFDFDHFLVKRTVFVLTIKNGFNKIKKSIFRPNSPKPEKKLRNKIVRFNKIYKFYFDHFLIKYTVFVLIVINTIKNKKFDFLAKHYGV